MKKTIILFLVLALMPFAFADSADDTLFNVTSTNTTLNVSETIYFDNINTVDGLYIDGFQGSAESDHSLTFNITTEDLRLFWNSSQKNLPYFSTVNNQYASIENSIENLPTTLTIAANCNAVNNLSCTNSTGGSCEVALLQCTSNELVIDVTALSTGQTNISYNFDVQNSCDSTTLSGVNAFVNTVGYLPIIIAAIFFIIIMGLVFTFTSFGQNATQNLGAVDTTSYLPIFVGLAGLVIFVLFMFAFIAGITSTLGC